MTFATPISPQVADETSAAELRDVRAPATLNATETWDCIVVGAGPAGSFAARQMALTGRRTLLVDSKRFPREKVCGGCFSNRGMALLSRAGLADAIESACPQPLTRLRLVCRGRKALWPLDGMIAIRRSRFDDWLVQQAVASGANFLPETTARVLCEPADAIRRVSLTARARDEQVIRARVVICADGLNHPSLTDCAEFSSKIRPASRIGIQAFLDDPTPEYPRGELAMAVAADGYVGLARVADGALNVAAAIDPRRLSRDQAPHVVIAEVLNSAGLPVPARLPVTAWQGTPALTRRSRAVAGRRIFLIGDAAGYVEPFTGEGMTWALASATALAPLADAACVNWSDAMIHQWRRTLKRKVTGRQWMCRLVTDLIRKPRLAAWALDACQALPPMRRLLTRQFTGSPRTSAEFQRVA